MAVRKDDTIKKARAVSKARSKGRSRHTLRINHNVQKLSERRNSNDDISCIERQIPLLEREGNLIKERLSPAKALFILELISKHITQEIDFSKEDTVEDVYFKTLDSFNVPLLYDKDEQSLITINNHLDEFDHYNMLYVGNFTKFKGLIDDGDFYQMMAYIEKYYNWLSDVNYYSTSFIDTQEFDNPDEEGAVAISTFYEFYKYVDDENINLEQYLDHKTLDIHIEEIVKCLRHITSDQECGIKAIAIPFDELYQENIKEYSNGNLFYFMADSYYAHFGIAGEEDDVLDETFMQGFNERWGNCDIISGFYERTIYKFDGEVTNNNHYVERYRSLIKSFNDVHELSKEYYELITEERANKE